MEKNIIIRGARQHNLKGINVEIPRNKLVVVTGLSGSGKSSLAFDTLYAEGQRRYVESLSAYARQFLDQMQKPDVEHIEGLSPAIAIEQRSSGSNPRSTVATTTEIYDYERLMYAHVGHPHCPSCGLPVKGQSPQSITDKIIHLPPGKKMMILAPYITGRKGEHKDVLEKLRKDGFVRCRIDGEIYDLDSKLPAIDKNKKHTVEAIVDRLVSGKTESSRLNDSVELALRCGSGILNLLVENESGSGWSEEQISEHLACVKCGISFGELLPRNFSFNSPYGACPDCNGLGSRLVFNPDAVIPDKSLSIRRGAIPPWRRGPRRLMIYYNHLMRCIAEHFNLPDMVLTPFGELPEEVKNLIIFGSGDEIIKLDYWRSGKMRPMRKPFEGVLKNLERRFKETESESVRERLKSYMTRRKCDLCDGARLKKESLAVTIGEMPINKLNALTVREADDFLSKLRISQDEMLIAGEIIKEIRSRLGFLLDVGLDYLTLDRESGTLSGGEAQRIRLATQIGSGLTGVLYILDEPSIGLHQRDNHKLIETLRKLRDTGNTVIVVEHDLETIRSADYVIDLGPGAGRHGGELVASGTPAEIMKSKESLTAAFMSGRKKISVPEVRIKGNGKFISIEGASQNNLKNIDVKVPLGTFCCVTGVSGSGKSSLVDDILRIALDRHFGHGKEIPGKHKKISGLENIGRAIVIDQSPIGRTPRSNPATYTDAFGIIRDIFAKVNESKIRGYKAGRFSFNVKGGRCEECSGDGLKKIEMQFLPDVYVTCSSCGGRRFNKETLGVLFKGRSIADILEMTVSEACDFFSAIPKLNKIMKTLDDVGLGYIHLGQPATTLSGGEAQRVKLAAELAKTPRGHTLYILDEPTTGIHLADVQHLLDVLLRLRDNGNTILVVEHNLDFAKVADYIIDLGPEGGDKGGQVIAKGTPEDIAANKKSYTGQYLAEILSPKKKKSR